MKTCGCCLEEKTFDEFHKSAVSKDGHYFYCKACVKMKGKDRYTPVLGLRKGRGVALKETIRQREIVKYGIELVETFDSIKNKDDFYEPGVY